MKKCSCYKAVFLSSVVICICYGRNVGGIMTTHFFLLLLYGCCTEIGNTQPQHLQHQLQQLQPGVPGSERRQQVVVPPRMQQQHQQDNSGSNRPKRYSSLRQRSLPESGATYAQPPPPAAYYQPVSEIESSDSSTNRPKRYSTIRSCSGTVYAQPDHASTYFQPAGELETWKQGSRIWKSGSVFCCISDGCSFHGGINA